MSATPDLSWQTSLLAGDEPSVDTRFASLVRHQLDERAWVDFCPGWLSGADAVFDEVVDQARWQQPDRPMYGQIVTQPPPLTSRPFRSQKRTP